MSAGHARAGDLLGLDPGSARVGVTESRALVRDDRMGVMCWVLPAGRTVPEHLACGPVTVHCAEGVVALRLREAERRLTPGTMVYLAAGERHSLQALADAVLRVTRVPAMPSGDARTPDGQPEPLHGERIADGRPEK